MNKFVVSRLKIARGEASSPPAQSPVFGNTHSGTPVGESVDGPSFSEKAKNASEAGIRLAKAVISNQRIRVSEEEKNKRLSICRACEYWNERGNIGLGECKHPQCGCTRFKQGLATESCPKGLWGFALTQLEPQK